MSLIEIENVHRSFGSTRALAGASLAIKRGEIVALMGANGAGKSTLVKILSGVETADSGSIRMNGKAYAPRTPSEAAAFGVVTVHQSTELVGIPDLTVADALLLNHFVDVRQPFFLTRRSVRRTAAAILREAGFDLPLDRRFSELGPAERQLIAIARALSVKAQLLILDEPTASLSSQEVGRLYQTVLDLKARGISVLYISHRTADIATLADRAVVLRGGREVAAFQRPISFDEAIEAMIGRALTAARPQARDAAGGIVLDLRAVRLSRESARFDLQVREGEVVAITGVLGAGKTRLLSCLFGAHPFAGGEVFLDGRAYAPRDQAEAISAGVVMAAEDRHRSSLMPRDWPGETIAATISLPHLSRWYPQGFMFSGRETQEADKAIARLSIKAQSPHQSIWALSGGNQQKVVLARWGAEPCRLLLLDEPFQGVDVGARQDIIAAIRADRSRATLIATSDPEEALEVADRVLVMEHHSLRPEHQSGAETPLEEHS